MGPELTDILSSLTCIVVMVAVLKLWKPKNIFRLEGDTAASVTLARHSGGAVFMAWVPVSAARGVRPDLGRARHQAGDQPFRGQPAARLPQHGARHRPAGRAADGAGTAQPDHAHPAGRARAGALRGALRAELAERVRDGVPARDPGHRARAARAAGAGSSRPTSTRSSSSSWRS